MSASAKDPSRVPVAEMAKLLKATGAKRATIATVEADVASGAPVNDDGTMNLLHYTAWLAREVTHGRR